MGLQTGLIAALTLAMLCASAANAQDAASGSFGIERGTGKIICTGDGDRPETAMTDDPSYAASAAWDRMVFGETGSPCGPQLTELDAGTWLQSKPFTGADAEGRTADFRLYVLHDSFSWRVGSAVDIEQDGASANPADIFGAPNFLERFCAANASFGFGASSHEGPSAANNQIAADRAATVTEALRVVRKSCDPGRIPILFAVTLGEYADNNGCVGAAACRVESARQRRVVIVAAEDITLGVDLPDALARGVREQDVFDGLDVDRYAMFDIKSY